MTQFTRAIQAEMNRVRGNFPSLYRAVEKMDVTAQRQFLQFLRNLQDDARAERNRRY